MEKEPRKASDIILALETKIDQLIYLIQSQDLNIKILSNKLNQLINVVNEPEPQYGTIEVSTPQAAMNKILQQNPDVIPVQAEHQLPGVDLSPVGFRRTSRPETYLGKEQFTDVPQRNIPTPSVNVPALTQPAVPMKSQPQQQPQQPKAPRLQQPQTQPQQSSNNKIAVQQRIVDKSGKAIFLADVEITNASTNQTEFKTRTNGVGKWQAVLPMGNYRVNIKKRESLTKEKIEVTQNLIVDGSVSPQDLQVLIIK
ncbi:MAG TPA: carboxypeptidase-like regulatory domain-containing protein [Cytophagaceae bacterium]|nr:carboxypeptidase-like regulatory domain-containing protein [Cytophagaceae bacterium]